MNDQPTADKAAARQAFAAGVAHHRTGDHGAAVDAFAQAARLDPDFADAHNNLGVARRKLGQDGEAAKAFAHAIALDPRRADYRYNLGNALRAGGRAAEAVGEYERAVLYGQAVARAALDLRRGGFTPDIMVGHNAWGETLFLKDIYPGVPLVGYFEFFYRALGQDTGFDPADPVDLNDLLRIRSKNSTNLLGLDAADWGLSPTEWQRSRYPEVHQSKISVIHDGVDTAQVAPREDAWITLTNGRKLTARDEVITYVARNLEPYRGFPQFMRAVPEILRRRPNAVILIVGGDDVSYGKRLPDNQTYRQKMLAEVAIDPERVLFPGRVPYEQFIAILQISAAHVYLTFPFVLSWSMLESMSAGCAVVGSRTPPVEEVIVDGKNGFLVDFFDSNAIADRVAAVAASPDRNRAIRRAARQTIIDRYDLHSRCLPQFLKLLEDLIAGRKPGAAPSRAGAAKLKLAAGAAGQRRQRG